MDRTPVLRVVALFFGTYILFAGLRRLTDDQSTAIMLLVQVAALALVVGVLVYIVRRRG